MGVECLGLELTDRCDLQCAHCLRDVVAPNSPRAHDIPLELCRRLVDEAKALGIPHVGLTGGEPMLHPHFLDIIDHIVDSGLRYHFLSNALGLPAFIPKFLARPERLAQLRDVCVSIDGATEATHEEIRGRGTFKRSLAGLAVLRASNIPFTLLHTITRVSKHEIDQMGLFAHHMGARRLIFCHFMPNGRPGATKDLDLTTNERHEVEHMIKRLMAALRLDIVMAEGYYDPVVDHACATVDLRSMNIDPRGHLNFCCELSNFNGDERVPEAQPDWLGDMRKHSLAEGLALQQAAVERFRAARLAADAAGHHTEDDKFVCRFCVRHFGKPEQPVVRIRLVRPN